MDKIPDVILKAKDKETLCNDNESNANSCAVQQRLFIYTSETFHLVVICACLVALIVGFVIGYLFSRRFHSNPQYPEAPIIEQRNHLDR